MAGAQRAANLVYAAADAVDAFVRALLLAHGVPEGDAAIVAGCLVSADLRGVETHGAVRLPGYLERVRRGLVNPRPVLEPRRVTPVAAALDGHNAYGFELRMRAMAQLLAEGLGRLGKFAFPVTMNATTRHSFERTEDLETPETAA